MQQETPSDPRNVSQAERDDRNLAELLQELRVAGLSVQVLFGLVFPLPFTVKFSRIRRRAWCGRPAPWRCSAWPPYAWRYRPLAVSSAVVLVTGYVTTAVPAALITIFIVRLCGGL